MKPLDPKYANRSFLLGRVWNVYARFYDNAQPRIIKLLGAFGDFSYDEFEEEFVKLARLKRGQSVLEVACGTGAAMPALSRTLGPKGEIVGADISSEMLHRAFTRTRKLKIRNVSYREVDAEKLSLDFDEESFDAVLCCNGLPNFLRPNRTIVEMTHVLREGGTLALSTINRDKCDEHPIFRWTAKYPEGRFAYKEEFREMLGELGFEGIKFYERGLMLIIVAKKRAGAKSGERQASPSRKAKNPRRVPLKGTVVT
jgi:ubiquinone/menaquinone biosynthesis C-methylase UbiE